MNVKEDMLKKKKEINEKTEIFIFVFLAFILLTTWAMTQPFNSGPDEQMRYYVADYIYKHHGALPGLSLIHIYWEPDLTWNIQVLRMYT